MIAKTVKYTDFNGVEREEKFFFNLTKAELTEMQMGTTGGFSEMLQRLIDAQDAPAIMKTFKDVIMKSYGEKSPDGKRFIKSEELSIAFTQTEAYSVLFMELFSGETKKVADFIKGIMPSDLEIPENLSLPGTTA